jgi:hypothetical protein
MPDTTSQPEKRKRGGNKTPAAKALSEHREMRAIELRAQGKTYRYIADELGYANEKSAYDAYQRARQRAINESADEIKNNLLDMINMVGAAHLPKAMGTAGDDPDPRSADVVMKAATQVAKLLGLEAPQKVESTVTYFDGDGSDLDHRILELSRRLDRGQVGESPLDLDAGRPEESAVS